MNKDILHMLWCLKNDADWAYKQALEGREPDMHGLGLIWKQLEQLIANQGVGG
jgi:hypothetical protein